MFCFGKRAYILNTYTFFGQTLCKRIAHCDKVQAFERACSTLTASHKFDVQHGSVVVQTLTTSAGTDFKSTWSPNSMNSVSLSVSD